jgi:hypothetical protein
MEIGRRLSRGMGVALVSLIDKPSEDGTRTMDGEQAPVDDATADSCTLAPSTTTAALSAVSSQQELALVDSGLFLAIVAGLGIC